MYHAAESTFGYYGNDRPVVQNRMAAVRKNVIYFFSFALVSPLKKKFNFTLRREQKVRAKINIRRVTSLMVSRRCAALVETRTGWVDVFFFFFTSEHVLFHAVVKGEIFGLEQHLFTGVALRGTFKGPPAKQEVSYFPFIPLTGHRRTGSEAFLKLSVHFMDHSSVQLHLCVAFRRVLFGARFLSCSDVLGMMYWSTSPRN